MFINITQVFINYIKIIIYDETKVGITIHQL